MKTDPQMTNEGIEWRETDADGMRDLFVDGYLVEPDVIFEEHQSVLDRQGVDYTPDDLCDDPLQW